MRSRVSNEPISPFSTFYTEDKEMEEASAKLCWVMFLFSLMAFNFSPIRLLNRASESVYMSFMIA